MVHNLSVRGLMNMVATVNKTTGQRAGAQEQRHGPAQQRCAVGPVWIHHHGQWAPGCVFIHGHCAVLRVAMPGLHHKKHFAVWCCTYCKPATEWRQVMMQQLMMVEAVRWGPIKQWWLVNPTEDDKLTGTATRAYLEGHNKVPVRSPPQPKRLSVYARDCGRVPDACWFAWLGTMWKFWTRLGWYKYVWRYDLDWWCSSKPSPSTALKQRWAISSTSPCAGTSTWHTVPLEIFSWGRFLAVQLVTVIARLDTVRAVYHHLRYSATMISTQCIKLFTVITTRNYPPIITLTYNTFVRALNLPAGTLWGEYPFEKPAP